MAKLKSGLHKDISTIFDGVPLPGRDLSEPPRTTATDTPPHKPRHSISVKPLSSTEQILPNRMDYKKTEQPPKTQPKLVVKTTPTEIAVLSESIVSRILKWAEGKFDVENFSLRKTVEVAAIAGLLIFLAVRVIAIVDPSSATTEQKLDAAQQDQPFDGNVDWQFPKPYAKGLRDPMVLGTTTKLVDPEALEVKGVLHSNNNSFAIIGVEIAKVGDVVSGATIIKIEENSVTFKKVERVWTQKIHR